MTLKAKLKQSLATLPTGSSPQTLHVDHDGQRLICQLEALDSLACSFLRLVVESDALAAADLDRLRASADELARRLSYLMEPISPIEYDHGELTVQLRSKPPSRDEIGASYYELLVGRGAITLSRWHAAAGQPRQPAPAHVTREVLLRLADDLAAVA